VLLQAKTDAPMTENHKLARIRDAIGKWKAGEHSPDLTMFEIGQILDRGLAITGAENRWLKQGAHPNRRAGH
jgi:hypothetical protein